MFYNVADEDTLTRSVGPPLPYRRTQAGDSLFTAAETLWVRKWFDAEGNLDSLRRWGVPNPTGILPLTTRYRYDRAHRLVAEVAPDSARDSTAYDPAGNPVAQVTRRGDTLRMTYDALSRLTLRITPAKSYVYFATAPATWHFPFYRQDATGEYNTLNGGAGGSFGLTIALDSATFTYDSLGNLRTADNRDARITRTYSPGGALLSEAQRLRTYLGTDFTQHVYTLTYTVDLNGRRLTLAHPAPLLPPGVTAPVQYRYNTIGQLDTLRSIFGSAYAHAYDAEGRLTSLAVGRTEARVYDEDGRLIRRSDPSLHADTLRYDARGKVLRAGTTADSTHTRYTGLGSVAWSQTRRYVDLGVHPEEQYVSDALASARSVFRRQNGTQIIETPAETRSTYKDSTGRLIQHGTTDSAQSAFDDLSTSAFDAGGNRFTVTRDAHAQFGGQDRLFYERTANYYGADGKLRVVDRRTCIFEGASTCKTDWGTDFTERQAFEEYRYDALGRRVLLRTRGEWGCGAQCRGLLQRFVWDGDQLLYEVSAPGATGEAAVTMERDTGHVRGTSGAYFTGRVAYTHGMELDAPLAVHRFEHSQYFPDPFTIVPYSTWKGDYDSGTGVPCTQVWQPGPGPGDSTLVEICATYEWPAPYLWVSKLARARGVGPSTWYGSLVEGQRDLTGQLYRRNRYYDPASGRFTQEDPIGLAGGLNVYGFAAGDPISFSDPLGLCIEDDADCKKIVALLRAQEGAEFQTAADRYDALRDRRVHLVRKSHPGLEDDEGLNGDGDPETWVGGNTTADAIYLSKNASAGDLLITAVHESYHFGEGLSEGVQADVNRMSLAENRAYRQLSPRLRATATRHSDRFFHWWGPRFGSHPVRAREAPYPTGERY